MRAVGKRKRGEQRAAAQRAAEGFRTAEEAVDMAEHDGVHGALLDEWTVEVPLALLNPVRWKGSTARMASSLEGSLRDGSGLVAQPGSVLLSESKRWRPPRIQLRWADLRGHTTYGFKKVTCRLVSIDGGGSDDDDEEAGLAAAEAAAATRAAAAQRRASSGRVRRRLMAAEARSAADKN